VDICFIPAKNVHQISKGVYFIIHIEMYILALSYAHVQTDRDRNVKSRSNDFSFDLLINPLCIIIFITVKIAPSNILVMFFQHKRIIIVSAQILILGGLKPM